jgi:hypothetical protein
MPLRLHQIARRIADAACKRICRRTIRACQKIEPMLLGDDTPLANAWEDICVQEQEGERTPFWEDSYGASLLAFIEGELEKLDEITRSAIWHQSDDGGDWDWTVEGEDQPEGYDNAHLARYILDEYVLPAAENYSNARISRYLGRPRD